MKYTIIFTTVFYVIVQAVVLVMRIMSDTPWRQVDTFFPTIVFVCIAALFLIYRMVVRKDRRDDGADENRK